TSYFEVTADLEGAGGDCSRAHRPVAFSWGAAVGKIKPARSWKPGPQLWRCAEPRSSKPRNGSLDNARRRPAGTRSSVARTRTNEKGEAMTADENVAIMRRGYAAFNSGDM